MMDYSGTLQRFAFPVRPARSVFANGLGLSPKGITRSPPPTDRHYRPLPIDMVDENAEYIPRTQDSGVHSSTESHKDSFSPVSRRDVAENCYETIPEHPLTSPPIEQKGPTPNLCSSKNNSKDRIPTPPTQVPQT